MLPMIVRAFQTVAHRDVEAIPEKAPFKCERLDAWLGHGYYFWDTNIEWAHQWGKQGYKGQYVITACDIDLNNDCLDLVGSVKDRMQLQEAADLLRKHLGPEGEKIVMRSLIELLKDSKKLVIKSIRSSHSPSTRNPIYYNQRKAEHINLADQIQICVIEKKGVILTPIEVVYTQGGNNGTLTG